MSIEFNDCLKALNTAEAINKISYLKKDLDGESAKEVDNFILRKKIIQNNNLINLKEIFTEIELKEQKECSRESKEYRRWLKKFKVQKYNPESFYGWSGLRWLPDNIKANLLEGIFIDAGAYDGDSAIALTRQFNPKKIYSIEPQFDNFNILKHNSKILKDIIVPLKLAISNETKSGYISSEESGSKLSGNNEEELIRITTIDQIVLDKGIEKVDLIKMDIEGLESRALSGAKQTILKNKPILAISIYHNAEDFFNIKPWLENLVPEYKFIIKKAHPFVLAHELMLIAYCDDK